jgi:type II secretory pathway pseudopilin PulG
MNRPSAYCPSIRAFTLVEVVLALGISVFALVALVGVLGTGLQSGKDSEDQIQATNLASLIISTRTAAPTNTIANFAIPASAMTNGYANAYASGVNYIGFDGRLTNSAYAAYQITCQAGTNAITGSGICQIYLMLSWPAQMNSANAAAKRYELLTYIPIR